jgi:hypothetical protein
MTNVARRNWLTAITIVTALLYLYTGADAHGLGRLLAFLGGTLILAAVAAAARSRLLAWFLLLAGALPVAVATWWSIVTLLLALLALLFGWLVIRRPPASRPIRLSGRRRHPVPGRGGCRDGRAAR